MRLSDKLDGNAIEVEALGIEQALRGVVGCVNAEH